MVPAVLAMPDQVAPPMTAPADLLTADQVALVIQDQVAPLMMVPVVQHIADRAARVMQDQVGHAIQVLAELGGPARQFVANYATDGIEFSDAVFNLKP